MQMHGRIYINSQFYVPRRLTMHHGGQLTGAQHVGRGWALNHDPNPNPTQPGAC